MQTTPRIFVLLFAVVFVAPSAFGADGKTVFYKSGDETVQGILFTPTKRSDPRLVRGQDHGITPDGAHKFRQVLKGLGKKIEVKNYDDAGHAFENPNNKDGYRPADSADAWKITVDLLASTLKQ